MVWASLFLAPIRIEIMFNRSHPSARRFATPTVRWRSNNIVGAASHDAKQRKGATLVPNVVRNSVGAACMIWYADKNRNDFDSFWVRSVNKITSECSARFSSTSRQYGKLHPRQGRPFCSLVIRFLSVKFYVPEFCSCYAEVVWYVATFENVIVIRWALIITNCASTQYAVWIGGHRGSMVFESQSTEKGRSRAECLWNVFPGKSVFAHSAVHYSCQVQAKRSN